MSAYEVSTRVYLHLVKAVLASVFDGIRSEKMVVAWSSLWSIAMNQVLIMVELRIIAK